MLETVMRSQLAYPIICHAEVDFVGWLENLAGCPGLELVQEEKEELCDSYVFLHQAGEIEVVLYHSGHAIVETNGKRLFDAHLSTAPEYVQLSYFNADDGTRLLLN